MKPLDKMTNVEKGRLLAAWFPELLPEMVDTIKGAHDYLITYEEDVRQAWDNGFINVDFWLRIASEVAQSIEKNGRNMGKSPRLFAKGLFDGYCALFTIDCITKYKYIPHNVKFIQAVRLLFETG